MERKQGLVPIAEALADLDGPAKALREASPQGVPRSRFYSADDGAVQPAPHKSPPGERVCRRFQRGAGCRLTSRALFLDCVDLVVVSERHSGRGFWSFVFILPA